MDKETKQMVAFLGGFTMTGLLLIGWMLSMVM